MQDFKMKLKKKFSEEMVPEWENAYMDYKSLTEILGEIMIHKPRTNNEPPRDGGGGCNHGGITGAFSMPRRQIHGGYHDIEEGLQTTGPPIQVNFSESRGCVTTFMMAAEQGIGNEEVEFFRRLDGEFNKVYKFYKEKVDEVTKEEKKLKEQMKALLIKSRNEVKVQSDEDIQEEGTSRAGQIEDDEDKENEISVSTGARGPVDKVNTRPAPTWNGVKINVTNDTPISILTGLVLSLTNVNQMLKFAFINFYKKLRLIKSYSYLNVLAFSEILTQYDEITSRDAAKIYMEAVDSSDVGSSNDVMRLMRRVEATFIKDFTNGDRTKGINILRPQAKRERHRVTFSTGFSAGCVFSLLVALVAIIRTRKVLQEDGKNEYMETMFPLYSFFGFIVLHIIMYAANIYYWRRYRVNYSYIFGFKEGTELGYRPILLVGFSIGVFALICVVGNLDMEVDPTTKDYQALTELLPLFLLVALFIILVLPFNFFYRTNRAFFLTCLFHCLAAPLYKVTFPDFFVGDQLTSQVQAFRSAEFYICYYGWGDFKHRKNTCNDSPAYKAFFFIVAIIPYVSRLLQCIRRQFVEKNPEQGYNGLKYFLTIVAICLRTAYSIQNDQIVWRLLAIIFSAIAAIFCTYWDFVHDWGLLNRKSKNHWLRDQLLVPQKKVYFIAMILNILLRFAWIQTVLDFHFSFMHRQTMVAIVASLEIIRRGIWNFFRLENEHLNNVGNYRAFKSVPLPFNYNEAKDEDKDD